MDNVSGDVQKNQIIVDTHQKLAGRRCSIPMPDQPYTIDGRKLLFYGTDSIYLSQLADGMEEGIFLRMTRKWYLVQTPNLR